MVESVATKNTDGRHLTKPKLWVENEALVHEILHKDHFRVSNMFFQYEQLDGEKEKQTLVEVIIRELFVHSIAEEQVVYTAVRKEAVGDKETEDLIDESEIEHHIIKVLMAELSTMHPDDDLFDAKVGVLGEIVRHHVREEEKYMFAEMKEADMDLEKLGQKFLAKKEELQAMSLAEMSVELEHQLQESKNSTTKKRRKHK